MHFSFGLAAGLMGLRFWPVMGAACAYEVFEQWAQRQSWGQHTFKTSGPEIPGNVAMDLATFALGHAAGAAWNRTGPVGPAQPWW